MAVASSRQQIDIQTHVAQWQIFMAQNTIDRTGTR
jgi:hypothetical protein